MQVKCKVNAELSSLELCWAAAFTRTRIFLIASTKLLINNMQNKHFFDLFQIYFASKIANAWNSAICKTQNSQKPGEKSSIFLKTFYINLARSGELEILQLGV